MAIAYNGNQVGLVFATKLSFSLSECNQKETRSIVKIKRNIFWLMKNWYAVLQNRSLMILRKTSTIYWIVDSKRALIGIEIVTVKIEGSTRNWGWQHPPNDAANRQTNKQAKTSQFRFQSTIANNNEIVHSDESKIAFFRHWLFWSVGKSHMYSGICSGRTVFADCTLSNAKMVHGYISVIYKYKYLFL